MQPWWERDSDRYQYELAALDRAGIVWTRDEEAFARGFLRLELEVDENGERVPLRVTFPDLYPYFRFEVEAPTLSLRHHQNPFQKNLCVMGRATHHWNTTDTVAEVLKQQLGKVIATGRSDDAAATKGLEQDQAEPYSDYYPCPPSMVVIPEIVSLPANCNHGTFTLLTDGPQGPPIEHFLRGVITALRGADGAEGLAPVGEWRAAFSGKTVEGFWARLAAPIAHVEQNLFLEELLRRVPSALQAPINRVDGGWLQIWGVGFPEEVTRRQCDGLGWVFVCLFAKSRLDMAGARRARMGTVDRGKQKNKGKKRRKGRGRKR